MNWLKYSFSPWVLLIKKLENNGIKIEPCGGRQSYALHKCISVVPTKLDLSNSSCLACNILNWGRSFPKTA